MRFIPVALPEVYLLEGEPQVDDRGLFVRTFCRDEFTARGLPGEFVQCSTSFNRRRGTLRGLHFQAKPHAEGKLVRCTRGMIYDVALDLRHNTHTFGKWVGVELTADNRRALYIPPGCAHGYQTLVDDCEVFYQVTESYRSELSRTVRWDDRRFGIEWPIANPILSPRDASQIDFDVEQVK